MSSFQIDTSGIDALAKRMDGAPAIVNAELLTAIRGVGLDAERYGKANLTAVGAIDRGQLRRAVTSTASAIGTGAQAILGVKLPYARPVEEGRRAGATLPPTAPIAAWLGRHGGDPKRAFVVARSIGRRGIRARPYLKPAAERAVRESGRHMQPAIDRIRARLLG